MKRRGIDLAKHYRQAFDYWTRLVQDRPRYVVLRNFGDFRILDFDRQVADPVDTVKLAELPNRWGPLTILCPTKEAARFCNDRESGHARRSRQSRYLLWVSLVSDDCVRL